MIGTPTKARTGALVLLASLMLGGIELPTVANATPVETGIPREVSFHLRGHVLPLAPKPPQLPDDEHQAMLGKAAGIKYDKAAYNRGKEKIKEGKKYTGDRNKQKRGRKR